MGFPPLETDVSIPRRAAYWEVSAVLPFPEQALFLAWTDEEIMRRWMVRPDGFLKEVEFEARRGGAWCYRYEAPDGCWTQTGTVREIKPYRTVVIAEDAGADYPPTLTTLRLDPAEGGTRLTYRIAYIDERERDRSAATGYVDNVQMLFALLADYLAGA